MGYRSTVKLMLEEKAFELVKQSIDSFNKAQTDGYVFKPHEIKKNKDNEYLLSWYDVKWYDNFNDVKSVTDVLDELLFSEGGYSYKIIEIGEDGKTEERSNNYSFGEDLYTYVEVGEPVSMEETEWE